MFTINTEAGSTSWATGKWQHVIKYDQPTPAPYPFQRRVEGEGPTVFLLKCKKRCI